MAKPTEAAVFEALASIEFPLLKQSYLALNAVRALQVHDLGVELQLALGFKARSQSSLIAMTVSSALEHAGIANVNVRLAEDVLASPESRAMASSKTSKILLWSLQVKAAWVNQRLPLI